MELSNRAQIYLSSLTKDYSWSTSKETTRAYLNKKGIQPSEDILTYQSDYSGITLSVKNKKDEFSAFLFTKSQIVNDEPLEFDKINEKYVFICGDHKTAQFRFFLSNEGEICTIGNDNNLNVIHSNFGKKIEIFSLINEIQNWNKGKIYFEVKDQERLETLLQKEFEKIETCSDNYTSWWRNENLIIDNGVWLDRAEKYFHVYSRKGKYYKAIVKRLESEEILK